MKNMHLSHRCERLTYRKVAVGAYLIVCQTCGETYGPSGSSDREFLAGFNRNRTIRRLQGHARRKRRH